ncbi:RidA family protein [Meiothermus taiwanensis]|jgi:2-iminobutanoate/2-iminopropanoate deaminase|uniref:Endoribonuclease L-PSP n=1 Tax=Meiothermus taiwanensis WR-220 TaxID=1339250 RepID=A0ABN5M070_9DEIN|nr:RidA family protein [Meiothermus taiwanensis]AWR87910.1 endoribonuclease L-PSP [Meiothermus taiwanensis WR-220]KIQ53663.1 deaminase [Meiothermus taiwanensis]KZK14836.1 deaminase [Meiothermus taiwanensis]
MSQQRVQTDQAPQAIGPYSQAIVAGGMVFCSGQIPLTPSGELVAGDVEAQTHQVMKNLGAVLEAAGSSFEKIVQTTCYLADMNDFPAFNKVYAEYVREPFPARATVQVARLPRDVKVEVACIALL